MGSLAATTLGSLAATRPGSLEALSCERLGKPASISANRLSLRVFICKSVAADFARLDVDMAGRSRGLGLGWGLNSRRGSDGDSWGSCDRRDRSRVLERKQCVSLVGQLDSVAFLSMSLTKWACARLLHVGGGVNAVNDGNRRGRER